jgi:uncharacterized protein
VARKSGLEPLGLRSYNNLHITFDESKRVATLMERGLDFADAATVLMGPHLEFEDTRRDYGETRIICYGYLQGRLVVVGYVSRGNSVHIFSMRKANAREKKRIGARLWF